MNNYIVFIITNRRPNRVITYNALRAHGYTGRICIVIDNEDPTIDEYINNYGDEVYIFNKAEVAKLVDIGDNEPGRRAVVYARNACYDIAEELGYTYFIVLDDDYNRFEYRWIDNNQLRSTKIKQLDKVFNYMVDFLKGTPTLSIAMAQGGDFIGGAGNSFAREVGLRRKCMNSFVCSTDRRIYFLGRMNEDVNTYVTYTNRGGLFFTYTKIMLNQTLTQQEQGGVTELYLEKGTYIKSFYSVMMLPSAVTIRPMGIRNKRLHHFINWRNITPLILSEGNKKEE